MVYFVLVFHFPSTRGRTLMLENQDVERILRNESFFRREAAETVPREQRGRHA